MSAASRNEASANSTRSTRPASLRRPHGRRRWWQRRHDRAAEPPWLRGGARCGPLFVDAEEPPYCRHTASVVGVVVRQGEAGKPENGTVPEKGRDDALADVQPHRASRAGVDEDRTAVRHLEDHGVALTDVEYGDPKLPIGRSHERPHGDPDREAEESDSHAPADKTAARRGSATMHEQKREPADVADDGDRPRSGQMDDGRGYPRGKSDDATQRQQDGPHRVERDCADRFAEKG